MKELPPSGSESFDKSDDSDGEDKASSKKGTGRGTGRFSWRVPLSADALHGSGSSKERESAKPSVDPPDGILPIFPKREGPVRPAESVQAEYRAEQSLVSPAAETGDKPEPQPAPKQEEVPVESSQPPIHPMFETLSHELWEDFHAAPPVPIDTVGDRRAAESMAAQDKAEEDDDDTSQEDEEDDDESEPAPPKRPIVDPDAWHESHTLHLNESVNDPEPAAPALPSHEAMAAEVAATEPDRSSIEALEQAFALPAAELPAAHPEASSAPLPPMTETERFQDMMQRADFNEQFVQAASGPATPTEQHTGTSDVFRFEMPPTTPRMQPPAESTAPASHYYPNMMPGMTPGGYRPGPAEAIAATEGAIVGGIAGAAAGSAAANAVEWPRVVQQPEQMYQSEAVGYMQEQSPMQSSYPQEQVATQPLYRQPEQPAPITNEQRTTVPYPEQFRQSAPSPAVETAPAFAPQPEQPERIAAVPLPTEAATLQELPRNPEPRTRTVESAWHRVQVESGTNRIVEGQPEGRAMVEEKRAESAPPPPPTNDDTGQDDPDANNRAIYQQLASGALNPMLGSGQIGMSHELESGQVNGDHRLGAPRSQIVTALTSPLLWVGVVVLLLAFFAAAFL